MFDFLSGENREKKLRKRCNWVTSDGDIMSTAKKMKKTTKRMKKKRSKRIRKTFWHLLHVTRQWTVCDGEFQHTRLYSEFAWFDVLLFVWSFFPFFFFFLCFEFSFLIKTNGVFFPFVRLFSNYVLNGDEGVQFTLFFDEKQKEEKNFSPLRFQLTRMMQQFFSNSNITSNARR